MDLCYINVKDLLRAIALGSDLPEDFLVNKHSEASQTQRFLHYPPVANINDNNKFAVSPHTDYCTLTMVFQDHEIGLSVQDLHTKEWNTIAAQKGMAVINVGDLLMRWSNDKLRSDPHRVM